MKSLIVLPALLALAACDKPLAQSGAYGAPAQDSYGAPVSTDSYGAPVSTDSYGAPVSADSYGAPVQETYGAPEPAGYESTATSACDTGYDPREKRLNQLIRHQLHQLPSLIETARTTIVDDIVYDNRLNKGQGVAAAAGMVASFWGTSIDEDIRFIDASTTRDTLYGYGNTFGYSNSDIWAKILGLPDPTSVEDCIPPYQWQAILSKYGVTEDTCYQSPQLAEFELIARAKLDCITSYEDDHQEAAEVVWALDELIAALATKNALHGH